MTPVKMAVTFVKLTSLMKCQQRLDQLKKAVPGVLPENLTAHWDSLVFSFYIMRIDYFKEYKL